MIMLHEGNYRSWNTMREVLTKRRNVLTIVGNSYSGCYGVSGWPAEKGLGCDEWFTRTKARESVNGWVGMDQGFGGWSTGMEARVWCTIDRNEDQGIWRMTNRDRNWGLMNGWLRGELRGSANGWLGRWQKFGKRPTKDKDCEVGKRPTEEMTRDSTDSRLSGRLRVRQTANWRIDKGVRQIVN